MDGLAIEMFRGCKLSCRYSPSYICRVPPWVPVINEGLLTRLISKAFTLLGARPNSKLHTQGQNSRSAHYGTSSAVENGDEWY